MNLKDGTNIGAYIRCSKFLALHLVRFYRKDLGPKNHHFLVQYAKNGDQNAPYGNAVVLRLLIFGFYV